MQKKKEYDRGGQDERDVEGAQGSVGDGINSEVLRTVCRRKLEGYQLTQLVDMTL